MKILLLGLIALVFIINLGLKLLQYRNSNKNVPKSIADVYNEEEYRRWESYNKETLRNSIISTITGYVVTFLLFIFNIHVLVFNLITGLSLDFFLEALIILLIIDFVDLIVDFGFSYYKVFVIEEKYGFNKSTKKLFFRDAIIKFVLSLFIITGLIAFLHQIYIQFSNVYIFLGASLGLVVLFIILMPFIQPIVSRLFNKMTILEEGSLKDKIVDYTKAVNFPVENIYIMDASKRSAKANAYFSGYGKRRRIVLYDTLLEQMTEEQIVAVLAHEAGHAKHKDILRLMPMSIINISITIVLLFFFVSIKDVSLAFGFDNISFLFGIILFLEVFPLIGLVTGIFSNMISRKLEYQADNYAATTYSKEEIIGALKVLYSKNLSSLMPNRIVEFLKYSHPALNKRVEAIEKID